MKDIVIVTEPIGLASVKELAKKTFGEMVKAVVDLEKKVMALGGELHADEEAVLLEQGSKQENLWGFNIYVDSPRDIWLEYDSMVNLRPAQGNLTRHIKDENIRKQIVEIVNQLIH